MRSPRHAMAWLCAAITAALVWIIWALMVGTYTGQRLEALALSGSAIGSGYVSDQARSLLHVVSMPAAVVLVAVVLCVGLWRGARRRAIFAAIAVVGINLSAQGLKYWVFGRPDYGMSLRYDGANTLPSGHTAMAASAAVALVLVVGTAWRAWAAWLGALIAAAMGYSTLVCQWHRPADVVAAIVLACVWGFAAVACGAWDRDEDGVDPAAGRYSPPLRLKPLRPLMWLGVLCCGAAAAAELIAWLLLTDAVAVTASDRVVEFVAYAAGSAATVAASCVGMAGLAVLSGVRLGPRL